MELKPAGPLQPLVGWRGHLRLHYTRVGDRTVGQDRHEGPLRVLQPLYPEGPAICHHVLVHPPGGVVGGDQLLIDAQLEPGAHAVLTTPGATRFYRSEGAPALQQTQVRLQGGARLEWLPMEAIAYAGCQAHNTLHAALAPGAEMIGWDVLALGLPAAHKPFDAGCFSQQIELPGVWLERGRIAAADSLLRQSPLGWAGNSVLATMWFASGDKLQPAKRDALLDAARSVLQGHALATSAGVSAVQPQCVVLRALAQQVEPVMQLLAAVRAAWRGVAWALADESPRIWRT